jgi:hypothetical protein
MNGVLRGKVLPAAKLLQSARDGSLRLPSSVFAVTVTGEYADEEDDEAHRSRHGAAPRRRHPARGAGHQDADRLRVRRRPSPRRPPWASRRAMC